MPVVTISKINHTLLECEDFTFFVEPRDKFNMTSEDEVSIIKQETFSSIVSASPVLLLKLVAPLQQEEMPINLVLEKINDKSDNSVYFIFYVEGQSNCCVLHVKNNSIIQINKTDNTVTILLRNKDHIHFDQVNKKDFRSSPLALKAQSATLTARSKFLTNNFIQVYEILNPIIQKINFADSFINSQCVSIVLSISLLTTAYFTFFVSFLSAAITILYIFITQLLRSKNLISDKQINIVPDPIACKQIHTTLQMILYIVMLFGSNVDMKYVPQMHPYFITPLNSNIFALFEDYLHVFRLLPPLHIEFLLLALSRRSWKLLLFLMVTTMLPGWKMTPLYTLIFINLDVCRNFLGVSDFIYNYGMKKLYSKRYS